MKNISTNTQDYKYHSDPLRQERRFVKAGVFEGKDSKTAKTAKETNTPTKTPEYEYHSELLRQHRRFLGGEDFKEKDSERTEKLIQLLNKIYSQFFVFSPVFFTYSLSKFFFSVSTERGFLIQFSEDFSVQFSKNKFEPSLISSQIIVLST